MAQGDPVVTGLAWVGGIVAAILAVGVPIRDYLRREKRADASDAALGAKSEAEATLYQHMSEQLREYRELADRAFAERNDIIGRVAALEHNAQALAEAQGMIDTLRRKLDTKDAELQRILTESAEERRRFLDILEAKDAEIAHRDATIRDLEQRQQQLDLRLNTDEGILRQLACPLAASVQAINIGEPSDG